MDVVGVKHLLANCPSPEGPLQALYSLGTIYINWTLLKVKVKESRNRPGVAQSIPGGLGSQIS